MTPEDLAARHPRLYHLTSPEVVDSIRRHGLRPTSSLLRLFEVPSHLCRALEEERRPASVPLDHPRHGRAWITDNSPLSLKGLAACLDDGLTPADWLRRLNARVFFWPDEAMLAALSGARLNRDRPRAVLVLDTLGLARAHAPAMELSPINSGATIRRPARRGLATFTPLLACSYAAWRRQRGGQDRIREVTVRGDIPDAARYLVEVRAVGPRG